MPSVKPLGLPACQAVLGAVLVFLAACSASDGGPGGGGMSNNGGSAGNANGGNGGNANAGSANGGSGAGGSSSGAGDIGDPCGSNADCTLVEGSECWTTIGGGPVPEVHFPGGFCGKACSNEGGNECGENAGCASVSQSGGMISTKLSMCTPPCSVDEDCRSAEGYKCQIVFGNFGVCAPP